MGYQHKLQSSRFELKYVIEEDRARRIRDYVLRFLEPDQHTNPDEGFGYSVHSLYVDSPDLKLCRSTITGEKNRFKLRIRFYDDRPDSPTFFEIKRRVNDVMLKQRAAVWKSSVPRLLAGHWPTRADLIKDDEKNFRSLYNFCELRNMIGGGPAAYTSYLREAYEPPDSNNFRVTFDRNLMAGAYTGTLSVADLERWARPEIGGVVLELKFTDRFPNWMHDLVQMFELQRVSVPKYVECVCVLDGSPFAHLGRRQPQALPV
jgi:hypothetical protein